MPSIGKDLVKIRTHLGLTIQDIQNATKIPVSTLETIENDTIFSRSEEGTTYIRSFIRSYGRALKIDDERMIKALDQFETGNYNHLLLQEFPELASSVSSASGTPEPDTREKTTDPESKKEPESPPATRKPEESSTDTKRGTPEKPSRKPPAGSPAEKSSPTEKEPSVKSVNWADMGQKFSQEKRHTPFWIVGVLILLILAALAGYLLYENDYFASSTEARNEMTTPESQGSPSSLSLDMEAPSSDEPENEEAGSSELAEVLYITIYAAHDALDPVRVWSDMKPRLDPYWLEQGVALNFEFTDTIRIRGEYDNLLLFQNGWLIERPMNFFSEEENAIELTRSDFSTDPKWARSVSLELPDGVQEPDSVAMRPVF